MRGITQYALSWFFIMRLTEGTHTPIVSSIALGSWYFAGRFFDKRKMLELGVSREEPRMLQAHHLQKLNP
jgi:hypothetical protein